MKEIFKAAPEQLSELALKSTVLSLYLESCGSTLLAAHLPRMSKSKLRAEFNLSSHKYLTLAQLLWGLMQRQQ